MSQVTTNDELKTSQGKNLEAPISLGCYVADDTLSSYGNFVAGTADQSVLNRPSFLSRWVDRFVRLSFFSALAIFLFLLFAPKNIIDQTSQTMAKGWQTITESVDLKVRNVVVGGLQNTARSDVLNALGSVENKPIWELDTMKLRQAVEALPWVDTAVIERRLPNILKVHIQERRAVALWEKQPNDRFLIDSEGRVLQKNNQEGASSLPVFKGRGAPKEAYAMIGLMSNYQMFAKRVAYFKRVEQRRWTLVLKNNLEIWLPARGVIGALDRLQKLDKDYGLLARRIAVVDVRLKDRITLMRQKSNHKQGNKFVFGDAPDLVTGSTTTALENRIWGDDQ